jgi:hypothetical protein
MLLPSLTLEQLRENVREAEALLRVARQHARDARDDPEKSEHASARIQSICREVEALFPGLHEPARPDPALEETIAALRVETQALPGASTDEEQDADADDLADGQDADGEGGDAEEADGEEDEEQEWDIDYAKLAAAIENETLMSAFPEPGRSAFKRAAQYLVESHERQELFGRVIAGFEAVSVLAQQNVEDMGRKLALALTLEELANKRKG